MGTATLDPGLRRGDGKEGLDRVLRRDDVMVDKVFSLEFKQPKLTNFYYLQWRDLISLCDFYLLDRQKSLDTGLRRCDGLVIKKSLARRCL